MKLMMAIVNFLMCWCERTGRVFYITGTAGPEDVYLIRYYIIRSRWFNFWIHQFLRSDRDDLHDHPWNFCTFLVKGSYMETKFNPETGKEEKTLRARYETIYSYKVVKTGVDSRGFPEFGMSNIRYKKVRVNTLVFRRATDQHKVTVERELKLHEKDQATITLFFSGRTLREWGFIKEREALDLPSGRRMVDREWIDWRTYLGLPKDTPGRG